MGQKIKYFVYALIPAIMLNIIQAFALVLVTVYSFMEQLSKTGLPSDDPMAVSSYVLAAMNGVMNNQRIEIVLSLYLVLALIVELIVGYFVFKQKSLKGNIKNINLQAVGGITLSIIGLGITTNFILNIVYEVFPNAMEKYNDMMQQLGIGDDFSMITIICAVIGAPIVEEICFRGFTLNLFEKSFNNFLVANICQALLFGIVHGNIIQGTYAFCIGMVLGYIRKRYDSIYASILGHLLFNFFGTVITTLVSGLGMGFSSIIAIFAGAAVFVLGMYLMRTKEKTSVSL